MREEMINHFINDLGQTPYNAERMFNQLKKHKDILLEYYCYMRTGKYENIDGSKVSVEGYTAERLNNENYLKAIGAYNYLIFLREDPVEAIKYLKQGLPRK